MPRLAVYLLGAPIIELDGVAVETDRRKAVALLAYLAVESGGGAGRRFSRETLATLFWPDQDQSRALAYLRRALWELNNALGASWLDAARDAVGLRAGADFWLDVAEFQALLAEWEGAGRRTADLDLLADAAALYRGEFMAGFTLRDTAVFDDWQLVQTEKLRQALSGALAALVDGRAAQGALDTAVAHAQRWLALDSLNESAHRRLMRLYAWQGQRAAALRQYEQCARLLADELDVAPEAATTTLLAQIKAGELDRPPAAEPAPPPVAPGGPPFRVPTPPTPFVGREAELAEIGRLLDSADCRLLTLVGPGGIGKTRLAIETAHRRCAVYRDGVFFASLAALSSPEQVVPALANTLQLSISDERDAQAQLLDYLREKRMLLVLDNYEQLLDGGDAPLPAVILRQTPQAALLVTSRARLNVQGEHIYLVEGLRTPAMALAAQWQTAAEAGAYSAVHLFDAAARRVRPEFALTGDNLVFVARICELAQGMPLAIELAASWMALLTPAQIAIEIARSLDFLETELRDAPPRQRSIRAVFDHSWNLLAPAEQAIFARLSVFRGSFTRAAAQEAAGATLRGLLGLVNKSLVRREPDGRFSIHELLRQYAAEQLARDPAAVAEVQDRHGAYYLAFLRAQGALLKGAQQKAAFDAIAADFDNVRAAWLWAIARRRLPEAAAALDALFLFYLVRALLQDLEALLLKAVALAEEAGWDQETAPRNGRLFYANLLALLAWAKTHDFAAHELTDLCRRSLAIVRAVDGVGDMGVSLAILASMAGWRLDRALGEQLAREGLAHLRAHGDPWDLALSLQMFADNLVWEGRDAESKPLLTEAIALARACGDRLVLSYCLNDLAALVLRERRYAEAAQLRQESLAISREMGNWSGVGYAYLGLAVIATSAGDYPQAIAYYQQAQAVQRDLGDRPALANSLSWESSVRARRMGDLAEAKRLREETLVLFTELDNQNGLAWGTWELGECERLLGDLAHARRLYAESLALFQRSQIDLGTCYYYSGMADAALDEGDAATARDHFQAALDAVDPAQNPWETAYAQSGLGRAALALGDAATARAALRQALHVGWEIGDRGLALTAVADLAALLAESGAPARALSLTAFLVHERATWFEPRRRAAALLARLADELPPEAVAAAEEAARRLSVEEASATLLATLSAPWSAD